MVRFFALFFTCLLLPIRPALAGDLPLTLTDDLDTHVTLQAYPQRIVSLAPSNTEVLFALGLQDRIVGLTDYCDYPAATKEKTKVGGFSNPNLEQIVALQPDLVLAARFNPLEVIESLQALNIPVFALAPSTLEETLQSIRTIGRLTGAQEAASALEARLRARVDTVQRIVQTIPGAKHPRVLWGRLEAPMYSAGPGSFIHDLILLAGGSNIAAHTNAAWPQLGLEAILDQNPDVIFISSGGEHLREDLERLRKTPGWQAVRAVQTGRVYEISMDLLGRPGPRLVEGLEHMAHALYPDRFPQ